MAKSKKIAAHKKNIAGKKRNSKKTTPNLTRKKLAIKVAEPGQIIIPGTRAGAGKKIAKQPDNPPLLATSVSTVPVNQSWWLQLKQIVHTPQFERWFLWGSLAVLLLTSLFWTVLSARLQLANADQLIDTYLFGSTATFNGAGFPGAHTFLIKWPLFALMALLGATPALFMAGTIVLVLATLGVLLLILYKIEPRPIMFGLFCLALASILLLIPAQPYPGALLPVNMAMTTTRNLEYAVYLAVLVWLVHNPHFKSWRFVGVAMVLAVLIASDKLFAVLAIGSALAAGAVYILRRQTKQQVFGIFHVLAAGVLATAAANVLLIIISKIGLTHIVNETSASPFGLIASFKQLAEGVLYAVMALLTNFGANAVHDEVIIRDIPGALIASLKQVTAPAYLVNTVLFLGAMYTSYKLVRSRIDDVWTRLSVLLLASTAAAIAVFVLTDHYYPVDARYITIGLFTLFVTAATYSRTQQFRLAHTLGLAAVIVIVLPLGIYGSLREYRISQLALAPQHRLTNRVAEELSRHHIDRLTGDYWNITPVKAASSKPITIAPITQCFKAQTSLSSSAWYASPASTATAYLAVRDSGARTYNGCTIQRIVTRYGVPQQRIAINSVGQDGQIQKNEQIPSALLLLYPDGVKPLNAAVKTPEPVMSTRPVELASLSESAVCSRGTTLTIVAHADDDILFANPDISNDVAEGRCMRSVYITAGDAGEGYNYWHKREQGTEAAYARMYNVENRWREETVLLRGHSISVHSLENVSNLSLVFLRLPDGNIHGEGFAATKNEALQALLAETVGTLHAVDERSTYTKTELIETLSGLIKLDLPDIIRTQGYLPQGLDGDHSDHLAAGAFTALAHASYDQPHLFVNYAGYPGKLLSPNLSSDEITNKMAIFLTYSNHDGAVCQTAFECEQTYTYGNYVTRQYKTTEQYPK